MKKKILSVILTATMLLTLVSTLGVTFAAEEPTQSGTVYEVTDAASVTALIADTAKNVAGNTMKLTQDLTYEGWSTAENASAVSLWAGCKMHIDGNGHKVILKDGEYHNVILFNFAEGVTELTVKNLAIVMENENAVAKSTRNEALALFGQISANTHSAFSSDDIHLTVENCYFDVNLDMQSETANTGAAILFSRVIGAAKVEITAKNTFFKGTLNTKNGVGRVGALYGRRWGENILFPVKINIENCGFEITTNNTSVKSALVGNVRLQQATTITATGTNLIYNDAALVDTITPAYQCDGFTTVVDKLELDTPDWKVTNTGYPYPVALDASFASLFANKALDGITVTVKAPEESTTPEETTTEPETTTAEETTVADTTTAEETTAEKTETTTTAPDDKEGGCGSVVGSVAIVVVAAAAAFVCKKKED